MTQNNRYWPSRRSFLGLVGTSGLIAGAVPLLGWRSADGRRGRTGPVSPLAMNDFVESYSPASGEWVLLNRKIDVIFSPSLLPRDSIDFDTVEITVNGERLPSLPVYHESRSNREFRVVPFPFWIPGKQMVVRIAPGVSYTKSGDSMSEEAVWSFQTEDEAPEEDFDPTQTHPLSEAELALAQAGNQDRFLEENLVKDYQNEDSTLYDFSVSVNPTESEVVSLGEKMVSSLTTLGAVGLAAPQLGINRRMFAAQISGRKSVYINPKVESYSPDFYYGSPEGCLSIEYVRAKVGRPEWITVEYDTPEGNHVKGEYLRDDNAKVWLHEYDHLNGILMVDRQQEKFLKDSSFRLPSNSLIPIDPRDF